MMIARDIESQLRLLAAALEFTFSTDVIDNEYSKQYNKAIGLPGSLVAEES